MLSSHPHRDHLPVRAALLAALLVLAGLLAALPAQVLTSTVP
jgi:hypothetical protein